jgi:hypothetical protein
MATAWWLSMGPDMVSGLRRNGSVVLRFVPPIVTTRPDRVVHGLPGQAGQ